MRLQDALGRGWSARCDEPLRSVDLTPDGRCALTGGLGVLLLWDATKGEVLRRYACPGVLLERVVIAADGRHVLAATHHGQVWLWDLGTALEREPGGAEQR